MKTTILLSLAMSLLNCAPPERLSPREAKDHVGKQAKVCGKVVSANFATSTRRKPTFLNLDEPYPRQVFTAVIWETDREKFGQPELDLLNKNICVTGLIEGYKGKPEIILGDPEQLKVE